MCTPGVSGINAQQAVVGISFLLAALSTWPAGAGEGHWAFELPRRHAVPEVSDAEWGCADLDAFILRDMEEAGLNPNPRADRRTLVRRLCFDLTGLPPSAAGIADGESDMDAVVERLLASPQFGVRWARLWLDIARYAEDQAHIVGDNSELFYPNAWLYRDWVIGAFNRDLRYDEFIKFQLAADWVEPGKDTNLAALGYVGLGPKYYRRSDPKVMADEWEDRVDTVSRGLLGLTVSCARCHDHKFDPISTEDYYGLAGVFASVEMFNRPLKRACEVKEGGEAKEPGDAMHIIRERAEPVSLAVHIRGDVDALGPVVPRRFLSTIAGRDAPPFQRGSGRLDLAEEIASETNPLTARVFVNRIWAELFGRPLVETRSNFGVLGSAPTHPELLDDLAVRFMENGWSLKWLIREIAGSSTYRQSSEVSGDKLEQDPANRLFSRMNRRRLEVEMWRDAIFEAAGNLDLRVGGESFDVSDPDANRRAIYARISRLKLDPMLALFDFPDPNMHAPGRYQSTTPLQKLFALNHPLMLAQAERLAKRLHEEAPESDLARVRRAYEVLYGREASRVEEELALAFLVEASWREYANVLLASNELLYLD